MEALSDSKNEKLQEIWRLTQHRTKLSRDKGILILTQELSEAGDDQDLFSICAQKSLISLLDVCGDEPWETRQGLLMASRALIVNHVGEGRACLEEFVEVVRLWGQSLLLDEVYNVRIASGLFSLQCLLNKS